jgi:hypothetical protein
MDDINCETVKHCAICGREVDRDRVTVFAGDLEAAADPRESQKAVRGSLGPAPKPGQSFEEYAIEQGALDKEEPPTDSFDEWLETSHRPRAVDRRNRDRGRRAMTSTVYREQFLRRR